MYTSREAYTHTTHSTPIPSTHTMQQLCQHTQSAQALMQHWQSNAASFATLGCGPCPALAPMKSMAVATTRRMPMQQGNLDTMVAKQGMQRESVASRGSRECMYVATHHCAAYERAHNRPPRPDTHIQVYTTVLDAMHSRQTRSAWAPCTPAHRAALHKRAST
jgi:hypothetical protein